jgi:hypothetical protein
MIEVIWFLKVYRFLDLFLGSSHIFPSFFRDFPSPKP